MKTLGLPGPSGKSVEGTRGAGVPANLNYPQQAVCRLAPRTQTDTRTNQQTPASTAPVGFANLDSDVSFRPFSIKKKKKKSNLLGRA